MRAKLKGILAALIFLLFFFCGLGILYQIFSWKDTSGDYYSSINQMYSMKPDVVDVAFFGPSAYYSSLNPAVFWEGNGIASFNAAVSGQDRNASTYYLKELLKRQSPKVVVLSATYLYTDVYAVEGNLLRNTLSLRESLNSIRLIRDLSSKNAATRGELGWKDFVLRWPIVHGRYREIKEADFVPVQEYEDCLGFIYDERCCEMEYFIPSSFDVTEATPISSDNKLWLEELKALGDKEGFEVIVVSVPTELTKENRACLNGCFQYLDEVGIRWLDLNFHLEEMDFEVAYDMADPTHANTRGAEKISRYLSDYLLQTFSLPDRRNDEKYDRYERCLTTYRHKALETDVLPYADDEGLAWVIANQEGLVAAINLHPESEPNPAFQNLLLNAGVSAQAISAGGTWILKDGAVACTPSSKPIGYQVNAREYLHVSPTEAPGHDTVAVGKVTCVIPANQGCCVVTYDTVLEKLIDVREIK